MNDWLSAAAEARPDHPAVVADGVTLTYAELDARAATLAGELPRGRLLSLPAAAGVEFAVRLHGIWRAGSAAAPSEPTGVDHPAREAAPGLALVLHTSGTTGAPRAVELTFRNLEASARASADALGVEAADRWLCPLPLHHVAGLAVLVRSAINATTAVVHERFDTERVRAALEGGEVTLASLVPTMLVRLRDAGLRATPGLRTIALGGGPVPAGLLEWAADAGVPVTPVYGMTETASQVAAGIPGRALAGVEIEIGTGGEILVRGPMVAAGELAADGWLHTGDRGRMDANGLLHIEGRLKELIVTGGENVAPLEVEQALIAHPAVADAAVAGRPDPEWGEAIVAFVVLREDVEPDELGSWCRARLAGFKVPKRFVRVESLPRNANGKLLRDRLPGVI